MLVQDKNDLDRARNRDGRVGVRSATPSAMFEKVLRAFEIGDLSFSDLQSSMTRLLNDGASADELLRVLRRRESIEPLPEDARDQIIAALHEAMPDSAVEKGGVASEAPAAAAGSGHAIRPPPVAAYTARHADDLPGFQWLDRSALAHRRYHRRAADDP